MNILKEINNKLKGAEGRIREEIIYAAVMKEIKSGTKREGLWAKALSESEGNKAKTESLYIKYRVQSIEDELQVEEEEREAIEAEKSERVTEANKRAKRAEEHREELRKKTILDETGFFGIWLPRILMIGPYIAVFFLWDEAPKYFFKFAGGLIMKSEYSGFVDLLLEVMLGNFLILLVPTFLFVFHSMLVGKLFGFDGAEDREDIMLIWGIPMFILIISFVFPMPLIFWLFN